MPSSPMITTTGFFLLMLFGYSKSLSNTRCFPLNEGGSVCYIQPDPLVALPWSSAMEWCKNIGSTLPIPDTQYHSIVYRNALGYFGLESVSLWLGANFSYDPDKWFWTNGTIFTGTIENRNIPDKTHAYVVRNGTDFKFVATYSYDQKIYICQYFHYSELDCAGSQNSYWTDGKCYRKSTDPTSYYSYLSRCEDKGLAWFDNINEFSIWLSDSENFWIGLRCAWWTWHDIVTGTSSEVIEKGQIDINWPYYVPNDTFSQCLASVRNEYYGYPNLNILDCEENLPFICQQYVNTSPTTAAAFTLTPIPTTILSGSVSSTQIATTTALGSNKSESNSVIFGLSGEFFVGLGGGLFLAVVVGPMACTTYSLRF